jgi:uncharacterized membrane protein
MIFAMTYFGMTVVEARSTPMIIVILKRVPVAERNGIQLIKRELAVEV